MSDCCNLSKERVENISELCPKCGIRGKKVELRLVYQMIKGKKRGKITAKQYLFCSQNLCKTVYFSLDGKSILTVQDMAHPIGQKMTGPDTPLCYCFNFTIKDIEDELKKTGSTSIPTYISQRIKEKHCACEIKNPQGSCCLANINNAIKNIKENLKNER